MAFGMIPNPEKSIVVDFSILQLRNVIPALPRYFANKYTLENRNDILNQYTFSALEFLSLGVYIDINLNFVAEQKTNVTIVVRRKMGAFDKSFEVQYANKHIATLFNGLSVLLSKLLQQAQPVNVNNPTKDFSYELSWDHVRKHFDSLFKKFPTVYERAKIEDPSYDLIIRRHPLKNDDVVINKDAIVKLKKISSSDSACVVRYEVTNDNNKIETQGELDRDILIITVIVKNHMQIINEIKSNIATANKQLSELGKWKFGMSKATKEKEILVLETMLTTLKEQL